MEQINFWIGIIATIAFAVTGVLAISDRGVDLFGVLVLGLITAIGGGTIRDIILEAPIFWSQSQIYVWLALGASVLAFFAESFFTQPQIYRSMLYLDGFGAALPYQGTWHTGVEADRARAQECHLHQADCSGP